ncbi:MAG: glucosyl-3-phosphoglycerate synthase [Chloroflexi bacterium]|nr:MAG: glucosyl-3-phosphoglycerate synthase [Chloroflexota bacterium]
MKEIDMQRHPGFTPIHTILVPFIHDGPGLHALDLARLFDAQIILVGVVVVPEGQSLSTGAAAARSLRRTLRIYGKDKRIVSKTQVIVSHQPWNELSNLLRDENPDLLCLEFDSHLKALRVAVSDALANPPCDVALARGKISGTPKRILVPVRGGPHAELAVRAGLGLHPRGVTALHIRRPDDPQAGTDAPFKGLGRVLDQIPEIQKQFEVTDDAAKLILQNAGRADVIILGATVQPVTSSASLGSVADRILHEAPCPVIAVKSGGLQPQIKFDESAGFEAISILVDKWFAENTFHADEFSNLRELVELKKQQGATISLALPALNEEETVGRVIRVMKKELMRRVPLLDEIVLIDSNSTDRTREIAKKEGIPVYIHQQLLPELDPRPGKGEALWKSLLVTKGDIVVWIDTDIVNIHPRFVYGIIGPLLANPQVQLAKGFYRRPLRVGQKMQAGGGGRVTELTARPLLNLFYPELSGVVQPLSGEYGGRRKALEQVTFYSGYGVETGLLIDIYEKFGLQSIAQVDLLERIHHNQHLEALSKMSFAIIQTVIRKLEKRFGRAVLEDVNRSMKLIRRDNKGYFLDVERIAEHERPPMIEIEEYTKRYQRQPRQTEETV